MVYDLRRALTALDNGDKDLGKRTFVENRVYSFIFVRYRRAWKLSEGTFVIGREGYNLLPRGNIRRRPVRDTCTSALVCAGR